MLCNVHTQRKALTLKLIVFCTQCYLQYDKEMSKKKTKSQKSSAIRVVDYPRHTRY